MALSGLSSASQAYATGDKPDGDGPPVARDTTAVSTQAIGTVAGQDHPWCRTTTLPRNDDGSSDTILAPFPLRFFGTDYTELWVNNNGNVTFTGPLSDFTPDDLTTMTGQPMIAPFFADVETTPEAGGRVTYGASPDGTQFCVNWEDVGFYNERTDKLNTFQLILRSTQGQPGRSAGDFDITFNYDQITWETGDMDGGVDGLGGISAAAGFTAGTGVAGSFIQLPGSLVNGALLNGGPNALVASSQGSTQPGRYVFSVRNDGFTNLFGTLRGSVQTRSGDPVDDAYVEVCNESGSNCSFTDTTSTGAFAFPARPAGRQDVRVWPPSGALFSNGATATVVAGGITQMDPIILDAPQGMPGNVVLDGRTGNGTVPSVYYGDPLPLTVRGCPGVVAPAYTVLLEGRVVRSAPLTEGPSGTYTATIPAFYPDHGAAELRTNVPATCGGAVTEFNVYIDPSGTVTDQWGRPIAGATVTLLRADTFDGEYAVVEDQSPVMSPSNRDNPDTTDAEGFFRWDVQVGWYRVKVEAAGCDATTTGAMQVPPERVDLVIRTSCPGAPAPVPSSLPQVVGKAQVGSTITAKGATWAAPLKETSLVLLRNGAPLPTASYTLTAADVGALFLARSTAQRPDYVDQSQGLTVLFTPVTSTSVAVTGLALPPTPAKAASTTTLKAPAKVKASQKVKVVLTVTTATGGSTAGKVTLKAGTKVVAVKSLTAGTSKKVVLTLKAKKLKKGKNKLQALFSGNATTLGSVSKVVVVKVRKR